jgi:DNA replication protein DnaC
MLDRPKDLPFRVSETKQVKLPPGETPETAYRAWIAKISAVPHYCEKHQRVELILNRKESRYWPVYEDSGYDSHWNEPRQSKPGEFDFRAVFDCPSCRVAYALCPPEFHETSFDTFDISTPERAETLVKAREFATQVNTHGCGFALFVGPTGPGKTRLACNVVRELTSRNTLYVRQGQLTRALRATYGEQPVEYDEDNRRVQRQHPLEFTQDVFFLVLDEIGCVSLANDERLFLDELLKHRYEHRKPTILISNLPLTGPPEKPGFKEFVGDALADRIKEATGNGKFIVQFTGESYRRKTGGNYLSGLA